MQIKRLYGKACRVALCTLVLGCVCALWIAPAVAEPLTLIPKAKNSQEKPMSPAPLSPLTPEETRVIVNKGTEAPFSGEYWDKHEAGTYYCRRCNAPLYHSADKFDSQCGWPSFDVEIPGAVRRVPDADGQRTEIVCAQCDAHLGHVFLGEGFTKKNTRHCVNSISMLFVPEAKAIFAGGCFWGVEDAFEKVDGVKSVISGYTGGTVANPRYEDVSTGLTGHAEAVEIRYDPTKVSYESLARLFFEVHDPTQKDRQGPDVGSQYRSAIFTTDAEQKAVVEKLVAQLQAKGWKVVTQVEPATTFYPAEDYHQDFTARTGRGACHLKVDRFEQGPKR